MSHLDFSDHTLQADGNTGHLVRVGRFVYLYIQIGGTTVCHDKSACGYAWNLSFTIRNAVDSVQESILCADISGDGLSVRDGEDIVSPRIDCDFVGSVLYFLTVHTGLADVLQFLLVFESFSCRVEQIDSKAFYSIFLFRPYFRDAR